MYKFIIVDDEPLIRRGLLKKLDSFEIKMKFAGEADNGEDALELVRSADPDIIITDMRMPVMDGKSLLKVLQRDYPEKKIIVISGYSDYEYMKEAISANAVSYLLKPFNREELHKALEKGISLIEKDKSLQQKMEIIRDEKEKISFDADLQSLCSMILGIHKKDSIPNMRSEKFRIIENADAYMLLTAYLSCSLDCDLCYSYIRENNLRDSCLFVKHPNSDQMGFFILLFKKQTEIDLNNYATVTAKNLMGLFSADPSTDASIGVSSIKYSLEQLNEAYRESVISLNSKLIAIKSSYFFYRDAVTETEIFVWEEIDDLIFYLESGNTQKVTELLEKFFSALSLKPSITLASVKRNCLNLLDDARDLLHEYFNSMSGNSISPSYEIIIDTLFDVRAIKQYLLQIFTNISQILGQKSIYSSDNVIDNIKKYIHKNYHRNLSLEKISRLFFINASYFSFLFKEKTGENFIDYVNRIRIDKAKDLVKNSDDKVYKIAKSLGYDNTKYFFRVFKKLTGCTPEEYRMKQA